MPDANEVPVAADEGLKKQPSPLRSFIAGGVGGIALVLIGHPLDTIKVRIQLTEHIPGQPPKYTGMLDCARKILTHEGARGFYKGVAAPVAGVTPVFALSFLGYSLGQKLFCDADAYNPTHMKLLQIGLAGGFSTFLTTPILAPGERVKCLLQSQGAEEPKKYKGTGDAFKQLYKEGGLQSVNRGFMATLLRDGLGAAFYFGIYEYLKVQFTPKGEKQPAFVGTFFAGGLAGIINWAVILPVDTLKTRLQVAPEGKYNGIRNVFVDVIRKDGFPALYRGIVPVMARAFPANAACFLGYEGALKFMDYIGME